MKGFKPNVKKTELGKQKRLLKMQQMKRLERTLSVYVHKFVLYLLGERLHKLMKMQAMPSSCCQTPQTS